MRLSRLEIYGFKSFAKKLDLKLTGGITAIVGPNGCGKTNVVDAIRWVLGEQRPTQIRLDCMEDVLFKGSVTRKQLGMSEVSLTIENNSGRLPVNTPEISITRRLFRSGESDYQLNRTSCRLTDINELFMDTGMGTDSYSVFELSMVNAILSDKTEDRRHIFEEAAGITKYKARRKTALKKLVGIQDDLDRVGDIIAELQRRVDSLKRQASKAKRYRKLKNEIKAKTVAIASSEIEKLQHNNTETIKKIEELQISLESHRLKITGVASGIEVLSADSVNVEKEMEETAGLFSTSVSMISEKEKELARHDSRLESLDEMVKRAHEASERNTAALGNLAGNHGDCAGNLVTVTKRLEEIEALYDEAAEKFREVNEKAAEKSVEYSELEKKYRHAEQVIESYNGTLTRVNIKREENENRLGVISKQIDELGSSTIALNKELGGLQEQKLRLLNEERTISKKLSEMEKSLADCMEKLEKLDIRLHKELEKQAGLSAERDFLAEVIRSYDGYSEGVKNAVQAEHLKGSVLGVLADLIKTDERFVPAVETALRENLQNILVEKTDDALAGARYLSQEGSGRAAFQPLEGLQVPPERPVTVAPGVIGPAHEFVFTEERYMPVIRRLLHEVVFVDSLETALKLRKHQESMTYVTLAGEMVGPHGDIHGGRLEGEKKQTLGRREKLENLTAALEKVKGEVHILKEERTELMDNSALLRISTEELGKMLEVARKSFSELSSSEAGTSAKKDAMLETLENLNKEAAEIKESFSKLENEKQAITCKIDDAKTESGTLGENLEKTESELKKHKVELDKRRATINAFEVERATLAEKKASLGREFEAISEQRESLAQSNNRTRLEIENAENEILETGKMKEKLIEDLELLEQKHDSHKNKKDEIELRYSGLRSARSEKERELHNIRRELDELSRKESSLILMRDETTMMINNIKERLREDYLIDSDNIPTAAPESEETDLDPENEKLLLEDLRRKLHLLGDVNLTAERDYEEEKKRLDFLEKERNDLMEAGNRLKETITKINKVARARFLETFEMIRLNFHKMFQEFFAGGVCDIELEEEEDPLEGVIRIIARPPGKNVRSINLLSSGERALTAIGLLFAIYLVKPSPFCILDEVDAPLDDANIERYLRVIKEFSNKTQFIMVTHNKKSMAKADNLYGITMAEPGLSTLVSVRLSEVDTLDNGGGNGEKNRVEEAVA
jgi:chromosome segregation protein